MAMNKSHIINCIFLSIATLIASMMWLRSSYALATVLCAATIVLLPFKRPSPLGGISYKVALIVPGTLYALTPLYHIAWEGNYFHLNENVFFNMLWGGMLFFGMLAVYLPEDREVHSKIFGSSENVVTYSNEKRVILIFVSVILFGAYLYTSIGGIGSARALRISGQSFIQTLSELSLIASIILYFSISANSTKIWVIFGVLLIIPYFSTEIFYFGDRRTALSLIVSCIVVLMISGRLKIRIWEVLLGLLFLPIILVFGVLRGAPVSDWFWLISSGTAFQHLSLMTSEFGASAIVANDVGSAEGVLTLDPSYHLLLFNILPASIITKQMWMMSPAMKYIYEYNPVVYYKGGGLGYNFLLDSFKNLSVFGPVLISLFISFSARRIISLRKNYKLFIFGCFSFATAFLYRMDMAGYLQTFFYLAIIGIIILKVVNWGASGIGHHRVRYG